MNSQQKLLLILCTVAWVSNERGQIIPVVLDQIYTQFSWYFGPFLCTVLRHYSSREEQVFDWFDVWTLASPLPKLAFHRETLWFSLHCALDHNHAGRFNQFSPSIL